MDRLRQWALTLRLNASGAIFNCLYFSLLVYPIEDAAESWDFLNNVLELQQGEMAEQEVVLRVVMRKPLPVYDPMVDMNIQGNQISIREGEGAYSMVLRNLFDIDYLRLIKYTVPRDTASGNNFFLLFPETAKREEFIIYKFLEENHANVYSWQTDGAWDYFVTYIFSGSVLVSTVSLKNITRPYLYTFYACVCRRLLTKKPLPPWQKKIRLNQVSTNCTTSQTYSASSRDQSPFSTSPSTRTHSPRTHTSTQSSPTAPPS